MCTQNTPTGLGAETTKIFLRLEEKTKYSKILGGILIIAATISFVVMLAQDPGRAGFAEYAYFCINIPCLVIILVMGIYYYWRVAKKTTQEQEEIKNTKNLYDRTPGSAKIMNTRLSHSKLGAGVIMVMSTLIFGVEMMICFWFPF